MGKIGTTLRLLSSVSGLLILKLSEEDLCYLFLLNL
jgi:hypothetical protein